MTKLWTPPRVNQNKHVFTNESRMERWFGKEMFEMLQQAAAGCGCLVPVMHTPKGPMVYAHKDVGFLGAIAGGTFSSLSDLIAEATGGKRQDFMWQKVGTATNAAGACIDLWRVGNLPAAAAAAAALAAGTINDNTTTGGLGQTDPSGGDTTHLTTILGQASVVPNLLMMYDRLWNGLIALSNLTAQTCTITGYPNSTGRYSTATDSKGNFAFVSNPNGATFSAVAHTWTMVYTDDAGNTGQSAAAWTGVSGLLTNCIDHASQWYIPLLGGDYGIQDIESIQCSVNTLAAGSPTIVFAHPLALVPQLVANAAVVMDGINSAFNLVRVMTDACIAFLEMPKPATTATTYIGQVTMVSG